MSADLQAPKMKPTLGLTGLTVNAMALIAPGAFLWLTFGVQALTGAPFAVADMWFGIVAALLLCFSTAISYAELSKLYPGAGSSYFFAEQAFLAKTHAFKFARLAKFIIGWSSHLYYWIYPGAMVAFTAIIVGYVLGKIPGLEKTFSATVPSPLFMMIFCVVFSFGVGYIAYRGVNGSTGVNLAINIIQISALLLVSVIFIGYRMSHGEGKVGFQLDPDGNVVNYNLKNDKDGNPTTEPELGEDGKPVPFELSFTTKTVDGKENTQGIGPVADPDDADKKRDGFLFHTSALSVVKPHNFNYIIIQACIAILILVGFESVTAMGEEAKNAKRDIPRAVLLSLLIQGVLCYLIAYFAGNYFLNPGYDAPTAGGSAAPIGDMALIAGTWLFGSQQAALIFMLIVAFTVFLALIGTTLSCMNTGARVTYAMGRDDEVPSHFGLLHGKNLTPHRAIWTLSAVSALVGIVGVSMYFCGAAAQKDAVIEALPDNFWYKFGTFKFDLASKLPQSVLVVALASNFGTFLLYMLTNFVAIVAFREHHTFSGFKHMVVPVFGLVANFLCMLFYLIAPFLIEGMSWKEPFCALGIAAVWGIWGLIYFFMSSKSKGRSTLILSPPKPQKLEGAPS